MTNQRYVRSTVCLLLVCLLAVGCFAAFAPVALQEVVQADSSTTPYYSGNYYNSIDTTLRGDDFRDKLAELITNTHTVYTKYNGSSELALNNIFDKTDKNPNGSGMVLFYTGKVVKSFGSYNANREHVWPKDGGAAFDKESFCGSDAHHLRPCDQNLNSSRGSMSYGETKQSIVKQGGTTDYDNPCYTDKTFFYPGVGYRGATARILMYVQTRWGNKYTLKFVDGAGKCKTIGDFKTLMKWHLEEAPTQEEINRNQAVYEIQGNRNPFIDHPEYAAYIYSEAGSYYANSASQMAAEVNALLDNNDPYGSGIGNVEPTKITLDTYALTLETGSTHTLVAGAQPTNANKSVTWSSKDVNVATVDQNGNVKAVAEGQTTVTATSKVDKTKAASCVVTVVKPRTVVEVVLDGTPTKTKYNVGDKFDPTGLTVMAEYDNGDVDAVPVADCLWLDGVTLEQTLSAGTTKVICRYRDIDVAVATPITVAKVIANKKTITVTRNSINSSGSYAWHTWTVDGISGSAFVHATEKNMLQMNNGKGGQAIVNNTALVGGIKTVTVTLNKKTTSNKKFTLYTSNKPFGKATNYSEGSRGTLTTSNGIATWQLDGNDTFFALYYADGGVVYIDSVAITYGNDVAQCDHVPGNWQTEKPSTCAQTGTRVKKCTECGEVVARETIAKAPHDLVQHEGKAATCTESGYEAYRTCKNCNYTTYKTIAAKGHSYGEWHTVTEATCTADGTKARDCSVCNNQETDKIAASGHSYGEWQEIKAATCTETGTKTRTCQHCDDEQTENIAAKGHSYGEWTVTVEPTATTEGTKTRTCSDCNTTEKQTIPATGETPNPTPDPDPDPKPNPDDPTTDPTDEYPPIGCFGVADARSIAVLLAVVLPLALLLKRRHSSMTDR